MSNPNDVPAEVELSILEEAHAIYNAGMEAARAKTNEQKELENIERALPALTARYAGMLKNPTAHGREMQTLAAQIETMRLRAEALTEADRKAAQAAQEWENYRAGRILPR